MPNHPSHKPDMALATAGTPATALTSTVPSFVGWALASLSLCMLLSSMGNSIANVGLPTLALTFGASFQYVQWVVIAYLLAITTLVVSIGSLGDWLGRRRLLLWGVGVFTVACAIAGAAPMLWILIVARAVQGLGAAAMMTLALSFVGELMPREKTGRAMGFLGTMSAIGTALGPSLGGVLIATWGWRAIFFVNLPLGLLAMALAAHFLPAGRDERTASGSGFDALGTMVLVPTLAAYALSMTVGKGQFGILNLALLMGAAVGVVVFLRVEARAQSPLIQPKMLGNRVLGASLTMSALVATVMMATLVVGPFYLARRLGLDAAEVGWSMSVGPLVTTVLGVPVGLVTDRLGAPQITVAGLVCMVLGCILLWATPFVWGVAGYIIPLVITTIGYVLFQTANNTAVMSRPCTTQQGVLSGLLSLARNMGLITGASAMGAVFTWAANTANIASAQPEAVDAGMRVTFLVAAALMAIALVLAIVGKPSPPG